MTKAVWKGTTLAESDQTIVVEGNHYFPPTSIDWQYFRESERTSTCPWKGLAHYYDIVVGDAVNRDAAWVYPQPKPAAAQISGYVAFWRGVEVLSDDENAQRQRSTWQRLLGRP